MDIKEKIKNKVKIVNKCWEWQGYCDPSGYGAIKYNGKKKNSHRVSYEVFIGEIPNNYDVCHKCDNRKCVNPKHLFIGTREDNVRYCISKGRFHYTPKIPAEHGTIRRYKHGCKCIDCRGENARLERNRVAKKKYSEIV